ncbi:MAG: hypothetical protein IH986_06235 [Planctomycetes bacterium]|nr:hypothetical protein [Planctomycetota bacterium]
MSALIDAWSLWFSTHLDDSFVLWGVKLLWWGRIGKLLQTAAILTVIIELIGAEHLRRFGNDLHGAFSFQKAKQLWSDANEYRRAWLRYLQAESGSRDEEEARKEQTSLKSDNLNLLLILTLLPTLGYFLWGLMSWWLYLIVMFFAIGLYAWIAGYVTLAVMLLFTLAGLVLDTVLIEPVAWAISRPRFDMCIRVGALVAAILGIHFDFLAS